jgi:hypothetical protein
MVIRENLKGVSKGSLAMRLAAALNGRVGSFGIVQWPVLLKFTIIIYDCSDSSQYYKTIIMIVSYAPNLALALASVVNYDHK